MDYQCVVVYTVISPSTTIAQSLRVQLERALSRSSTPGWISWIKYNVKRLISNCISYRHAGVCSVLATRQQYSECVTRVPFAETSRRVVGCGDASRFESSKELPTQIILFAFDHATSRLLDSFNRIPQNDEMPFLRSKNNYKCLFFFYWPMNFRITQ